MKKDVKQNILVALDTCAKSCTVTTNSDVALQMADACEKLANAYKQLKG